MPVERINPQCGKGGEAMLQFTFSCCDETGGTKSTQGRKLSFQHTVHHGEISGKEHRRNLKKLWKKHCFLVCSLAGLSIAIFLTYPRTICHGVFPISMGLALLYQQNNLPTHMAAGPSALGIPST